jgi:hypothetical protein
MKRTNRRAKKTPKKRTKKKMPEHNGDFWKHKTIEELAKEQGTTTDVDKLIGRGKDLWASDEEFERFLAGIYERRRQGRQR